MRGGNDGEKMNSWCAPRIRLISRLHHTRPGGDLPQSAEWLFPFGVRCSAPLWYFFRRPEVGWKKYQSGAEHRTPNRKQTPTTCLNLHALEFPNALEILEQILGRLVAVLGSLGQQFQHHPLERRGYRHLILGWRDRRIIADAPDLLHQRGALEGRP